MGRKASEFSRKIAILTLAAVLLGSPAAASEETQAINVLAASSLSEVMAELSRRYSQRERISVSTLFDDPAMLAESIEMGEPGDILIVEDEALMNNLKNKGLLDVFRLTTLAGNRLVLAVPSDSYLVGRLPSGAPLSGLLKYINERTLLTVPDPASVIAGAYIREALENMKRWEAVKPFLVKAASPRSAAYLVSHGGSAGILYYTDAFDDPAVTMVAEFESALHRPILYHAGVVASENMPVARRFLEFLKSEEAAGIFKKHGFTPL